MLHSDRLGLNTLNDGALILKGKRERGGEQASPRETRLVPPTTSTPLLQHRPQHCASTDHHRWCKARIESAHPCGAWLRHAQPAFLVPSRKHHEQIMGDCRIPGVAISGECPLSSTFCRSKLSLTLRRLKRGKPGPCFAPFLRFFISPILRTTYYLEL